MKRGETLYGHFTLEVTLPGWGTGKKPKGVMATVSTFWKAGGGGGGNHPRSAKYQEGSPSDGP